MKQEQVDAYIHSLNVQDKQSYKMCISACVKYFDERGIEQPTVEDWQALSESLKADGKSATTIKQNYIGRAKKFYAWCVSNSASEPETSTLLLEQPVEQPQAVRVNFMLKTEIQKLLALFMAIEHKTLTDILNEAAGLYIKEHSEDLKKKLDEVLAEMLSQTNT